MSITIIYKCLFFSPQKYYSQNASLNMHFFVLNLISFGPKSWLRIKLNLFWDSHQDLKFWQGYISIFIHQIWCILLNLHFWLYCFVATIQMILEFSHFLSEAAKLARGQKVSNGWSGIYRISSYSFRPWIVYSLK